MARLRQRAWRHRPTTDVLLELQIGPGGTDFTLDELRAAWDVERDRAMAAGGIPGTRPWAFWRFDVGEDMPSGRDAQTSRLAELGLLEPDELAALAERAHEAGLRTGTPAERFSGGGREHGVPVDVGAVELWDAVRAAAVT